MAVTKTGWKRPELVILARSRPEEAVLVVCKVNSPGGVGAIKSQCRDNQNGPCNVQAAS